MEADGLLWAKTPFIAEALAQIGRAKVPERRIPGSALAVGLIGAAGDVPPFHDFTNKAAAKQSFAMGA
jgi:hypothetical protein